jgi:hypothetical protein
MALVEQTAQGLIEGQHAVVGTLLHGGLDAVVVELGDQVGDTRREV